MKIDVDEKMQIGINIYTTGTYYFTSTIHKVGLVDCKSTVYILNMKLAKIGPWGPELIWHPWQ